MYVEFLTDKIIQNLSQSSPFTINIAKLNEGFEKYPKFVR